MHSDQLRDIAQLLYKSLATEQQESVELALPQYTSCFEEVNKPSPLTVLVRVEHGNSMCTHGCLECMHLPCSLSLLSYSTATYMYMYMIVTVFNVQIQKIDRNLLDANQWTHLNKIITIQ